MQNHNPEETNLIKTSFCELKDFHSAGLQKESTDKNYSQTEIDSIEIALQEVTDGNFEILPEEKGLVPVKINDTIWFVRKQKEKVLAN